MIKLCIFDLDGTLLDTIGTIRYHLNRALAEEGIAPITLGQTRDFIGNGAKALVKRALAAGGVTDEATLSRTLSRYNDAYDADPVGPTVPYPGMETMLKTLHGAGVLLAVVSNKPDPTVKKLISHFFPGLFAEATGGREGVPLKPAPDALRLILDAYGISPEETAYFGDSGVDMQTGKNLGARITGGVLWGFRGREELTATGADLLLSSPEEITEAVLHA